MSGCTVTPIVSDNKACSGKCRGGGCGGASRVWVLAACDGMISIFEKGVDRNLLSIQKHDSDIFPSLEQFQKLIDRASHSQAFNQLIIIGGKSDISWVHAILPQSAIRSIVAEIEYPLLAVWFKQKDPFISLKQALKNLL